MKNGNFQCENYGDINTCVLMEATHAQFRFQFIVMIKIILIQVFKVFKSSLLNDSTLNNFHRINMFFFNFQRD